MAKLQSLLRADEIQARVEALAQEIGRDYASKHPVLLGVLKGSFVFLADLVRRLDFPLEVDFVRLASYGARTETSELVKVISGPKTPLRGRHVLVVEDIVDTGLCLQRLRRYLQRQRPASVRLCALLDKPARHRVECPIDYLGFQVPDAFLVGYGLDCAERYRNLPDICTLGEP